MTQADIFSVGAEFKGPDGTVYVIKKPNGYQQGEFQRWLEQRAHDAVERSIASEDSKARRHHLIDIDAGLGKYEWDGPLALEAMWTPVGIAKILTIICRDQGVNDSKAEEILAHSIKEVAVKMLMRAAKDPKALAPVLGALGLPMDWMESEPSDSSSSSSPTPPSDTDSTISEASTTTSSPSSTTLSGDTTGS